MMANISRGRQSNLSPKVGREQILPLNPKTFIIPCGEMHRARDAAEFGDSALRYFAACPVIGAYTFQGQPELALPGGAFACLQSTGLIGFGFRFNLIPLSENRCPVANLTEN